jgi:predicted DNA-binding transcriptional regulator
MSHDLDPEAVDLATLTSMLHDICGTSVASAVMGRTRLRNEVSRRLGCSLLTSETLVDTMIARGFVRQKVHSNGWVYWAIASKSSG